MRLSRLPLTLGTLAALGTAAGAQPTRPRATPPKTPAPTPTPPAEPAPEPLPPGAPPPADSSVRRPIQIGLTLGTRGVGIEAARLVAPRVGLRVGASGAGGSVTNLDIESLTVDGSVRHVSAHALLDLYPFRRASLHLTGGVLSGTTNVTAHAVPQAGVFTLNDVTYQSGEVGALVGRVSLPRAMPYAGIGFGRPSSFGFRFVPFTDLGVAFGRATPELRAENAPNDPRLAADVEAERLTIDHDLGRFPFLPVVTMTFAWRF